MIEKQIEQAMKAAPQASPQEPEFKDLDTEAPIKLSFALTNKTNASPADSSSAAASSPSPSSSSSSALPTAVTAVDTSSSSASIPKLLSSAPIKSPLSSLEEEEEEEEEEGQEKERREKDGPQKKSIAPSSLAVNIGSFNSLKKNEATKRKLNPFEELIKNDEMIQEKKNRKDYWITPGIVVKIINKDLGDGKFYKKKALIKSLVDRYVAKVKVLDTGHLIEIDQEQLETVIPVRGGKQTDKQTNNHSSLNHNNNKKI